MTAKLISWVLITNCYLQSCVTYLILLCKLRQRERESMCVCDVCDACMHMCDDIANCERISFIESYTVSL